MSDVTNWADELDRNHAEAREQGYGPVMDALHRSRKVWTVHRSGGNVLTVLVLTPGEIYDAEVAITFDHGEWSVVYCPEGWEDEENPVDLHLTTLDAIIDFID